MTPISYTTEHRVYADNSAIPNPTEFSLLMSHLPFCVQEAFNDYHPWENKLNKYIEGIKSCRIFFEDNFLKRSTYSINSEEHLYKVARAALLAYKIHKLSFAELITTFMHMGAIEEFQINPKMNYVNSLNQSFYTFLKDKSPDFKVITNKGHALYNANRADWLREENSDYLKKISSPKMHTPFLKDFFYLTQKEWESFDEKMQSAEGKERWFLTFHSPLFGCWSPLYDQIQKVMRCFKTLSFYEKGSDYKRAPTKSRRLILPSFTMLKNFIAIKAENHGRQPIELAPVFSRIDYDDVYNLKRENKIPLGLYCPMPPFIKASFATQHMRQVDGWTGNGPYSFLLHDLAHALRWQEMDEKCIKAVLYCIQSLDNYAKQLEKASKEYKEIRYLRNSLIDGELIFSYPPENSLYRNRPFETQNFGSLFHYLKWPQNLHYLIFYDMLNSQDFWEKELQINSKDLMNDDDDEQQSLTFKFWATLKILFEEMRHIEDLQHIDALNADFITTKNGRISASTVPKLHCRNAIIINSKIEKIKAHQSIFIKECHIESHLSIKAKKCVFINCLLASTSIIVNASLFHILYCDIEKLFLQNSCTISYCQKINHLICSKALEFENQNSTVCESIQASSIRWQSCQEQLVFHNIKCKEFTLVLNGNETHINFLNTEIGKLILEGTKSHIENLEIENCFT